MRDIERNRGVGVGHQHGQQAAQVGHDLLLKIEQLCFRLVEAVDEFVGQLRGDIQRKPGLTNSTDANQCHQPMRTHGGLDVGDLQYRGLSSW